MKFYIYMNEVSLIYLWLILLFIYLFIFAYPLVICLSWLIWLEKWNYMLFVFSGFHLCIIKKSHGLALENFYRLTE